MQEVDVELAGRLVARQFPEWAELPVRNVEVGGWDNRTYRLGDRLSLRFPVSDWHAQQVAKEQRWLPQLARQLPLPIPEPVAEGQPDLGYPYAWSVYGWLEGRTATRERIDSLSDFAQTLAEFLVTLGEVDSEGGPRPGPHNFFRGASLGYYADEAMEALEAVGDTVDRRGLEQLWRQAMASTWDLEPVWIHGDVAAGNLLVTEGQLSAVIDFGSAAVGDPACDAVIAWTLLDAPSREVFRRAWAPDDATWRRGRGWAAWKALISIAGRPDDPAGQAQPRRDLAELLADCAQHP